ncbi:MAG TPA: hypothetical protein VF297_23710 [Pyrinomonadaceae bacterium]
MKNVLRVLSALGLACAILFTSFPHMASAQGRAFPRARALGGGSSATGETIPVVFDFDEDSFCEFSQREKRDQLRHWLLLTALSAADVPPERIGELTFDRPVIGCRYLRPLGNLEYGETRSTQINETDVVALVPAGKSAAEQADLIAQVADERRKDSGNTPGRLLVFEYKIDLPNRVASLTRRGYVSAREIFSPAYGYTEATINTLAEFTQFMGAIDEITTARQNAGGGVTLGGRKYKATTHRGLRVEDVAALWQSEAKIAEREQSRDDLTRRIDEFYKRRDKAWQAFEARWSPYMGQLVSKATLQQYGQEKAQLEARLKREEGQLAAAVAREKRAPRMVSGSGFSLDPSYKFDELLRFFDATLAPTLRKMSREKGSGFTLAQVNQARQGLVTRDAGPLMRLLGRLVASGDEWLANLFNSVVREGYTFQQARYDGDLQGTEVGMVLFYTDLLAKLWAMDYHHESSPSSVVKGFRALTETIVSPVFENELKELTKTRLWFGPQDKGYQVSADGQGLLLGSRVTRVYSASSSTFNPGVESAAATNSGAFLDWWDDHYEEIARYEPEYQRLDEVMKWSLLIGWLNDVGKGNQLGFLAGVPVKRTNWFPDWVRQHPELKFQQWDEINFFARGFNGSSTEAMPLLFSKPFYQYGAPKTLSGGVSLARKGLVRERIAQVRDVNVKTEFRRPSIVGSRPKADGKPLSLETKEGITYSFAESGPGHQAVTITAKPDVRLRSTSGELGNVPLRQTVRSEPAGFKVEVGAGEVPVGSLNVERSQGAFRVGWRGRDAEVGQAMARRLSRHPRPAEMLALDPRVEAAYQLGDGGPFLVKMKDSERWMKVEAGGGGNTPPPGGPPKVAIGAPDPDGESRTFLLGWIDKNEAQRQLSAGGRGLKIQPVERDVVGVKGVAEGMKVQTHAGNPPADAVPVTIKSQGQVINAKVDPATKTLYVGRNGLPPALEGNPAWVAEQLKPADVQRISEKAKISRAAFEYDTADPPQGNSLVEEASYASRLIESGHYREAERQLSTLIGANGSEPRLKVLRAISRLKQGMATTATDELGALARATGDNRTAFLDEVNSRLRDYFGPDLTFARNGTSYELRHGVKVQDAVPVSASDAITHEVDVYVLDSLSVADADWSPANLTNTINQLITGGLGRGSRLPPGGADNFRPSAVYDNGGVSGGGGRRYVLKGHIRYDTPTARQPIRVRAHRPVFACVDDDDDDDETECEELVRGRTILLISEGQGAPVSQ